MPNCQRSKVRSQGPEVRSQGSEIRVGGMTNDEIEMTKVGRNRKWGIVVWVVRVVGKLSWLARRVGIEHAAAMGASLTRRVWIEQLGWHALRNQRRDGPTNRPFALTQGRTTLRDVPPMWQYVQVIHERVFSRSPRGGGCRGRRSGPGRGARWPGAWPSPGRRGRRRGRQWGTPGAGGRGSGSKGSWT